MKDSYEKPNMVVETVDIPVLAQQCGSGAAGGPVEQLEPFFGLCCGGG